MMTLYGIKNCDTVRKARRTLEQLGAEFRFVDFDETPVDEATLRRWLTRCEIKQLFNTRSTTYRSLGLKADALSDEEKIAWMVKENRLIKRPVLETEHDTFIGFDASAYRDKITTKER